MVHEEPNLADYALIGNCCAAALVSRYGSIDWCCLPEFDSPAVFAALLDRERGGYFSIAPVEKNQSHQKYLTDTNVVQARFTTSEGVATLTDAFTALEEKDKSSLFPDHEILRIVEGISGTVRMRLEYCPAIHYGKKPPVLKHHKKLGIQFTWKENIIILLSTLDPEMLEMKYDGTRIVAEFDVSEGAQVIFSLSCDNQSPAVIPELKHTAAHRMQQTIDYWRRWIHQCQYTGVYRDHVKRSALTLKLLAHAPSGSIIAAPTTSLPETPGGERNWDYRFCWLRDASFTTRVLVGLGFEDEAHAYMNWILHATQLTRPELQVVYSVYGHSRLKEQSLDWLSGYKDSRPVRIGNKADAQFQLDVYGEVLDAIYTYAPLAKEFDTNTRKFIIGLGKVICKVWHKPDHGIWEIRSSTVHHTHSKVMAWVGLDRLIKLCDQYRWKEVPRQKFYDTMALIRETVERDGYNPALNSYTRELNGRSLDASLLTLSLVGYCDYSSPRMVATVALIREQLSKGNLVYRYRNIDDGLEGEEGSFAVCNFWLIENLCRTGKVEEAISLFETMLQHASPTGLFSEEIYPGPHGLAGNYPQGFTHIGLINAAIAINETVQKKTLAYEYS